MFRYSIILKSSFNEILDLYKIELCLIKLIKKKKKKKKLHGTHSIKNATIGQSKRSYRLCPSSMQFFISLISYSGVQEHL